jgi:hypothetical protein
VLLSVSDRSIVAGDAIDELVSGTLVKVGVARTNGTASISTVTDGTFVIVTPQVTPATVRVVTGTAVGVVGLDKQARSGTKVTVHVTTSGRTTTYWTRVRANHDFFWTSHKLVRGRTVVHFVVGTTTVKTTVITAVAPPATRG